MGGAVRACCQKGRYHTTPILGYFSQGGHHHTTPAAPLAQAHSNQVPGRRTEFGNGHEKMHGALMARAAPSGRPL
eukprot:362554-Chlamydomonas_euryale.AAC.3